MNWRCFGIAVCWALASALMPIAGFAAEDVRQQDQSSFFTSPDPSPEPLNTLWIPLASVFFPGLGQLVEGQMTAAATYFSLGLSGQLYYSHYVQEVRDYQASDDYLSASDEAKENRATHGEAERKAGVGFQLYFASGSFSAYHSFRTRVLSHQAHGGYAFLQHEETPWDILAAPLRFDFLKRSSTWVPLGLITGVALLGAVSPVPDDFERDPLSGSDVLFAGLSSLGAGTHEEAMFRGWIMPMLYEQTGSPFWSNGLTSLFFAAAHLSSVDVPLAQLLLGYHLGSVTIENQWRISEAVFIHTWWDVVAFLAIYQYKKREPEAARALNPVLWLPPFEWRF